MKTLTTFALLASVCISIGCASRSNSRTELTLRTPDGAPASDAQVVLVGPGQSVTITGGTIVDDANARRLPVDRRGRVHFTWPGSTSLAAPVLVAVHPTGYAQIRQTSWRPVDSGDLRLQKWGRIEGRLTIGDRPGAFERVGAWAQDANTYNPYNPSITHDLRATTDADGRFVIDRVPPGRVVVGRYVQWTFTTGYGGAGLTQKQRVTVAPGEAASANLGGAGRVVTGKVLVPRELGPPAGLEFGVCAANDRQEFRILQPGDEPPLSQMYPAEMKSDGTFRLVDVSPGRYELSLEVRSTTRHPARRAGDVLASAKASFFVPAGPSDPPVELPMIALVLHTPVPRVGEVAPDFLAKRLEGGESKLSDFAGRYVLLDFWATTCAPCIRQTEPLKALYNEFGKDGRLVMISLSADESRAAPLKYTRGHAMQWHQCYIGPDGAVATTYGITGMPSTWLIGPDGKVIAKSLQGDDIRAAVAKALGKNPSP